jgi:predicted AlkP superfamily pyrophosphatase or phosphodiesterase
MRLPFRQGRRVASRPLLLILLLLALVAHAPLAGVGASARQSRSEDARRAQVSTRKPAKPRLVLLIAVDQFRYDYLERFGDIFAENGIRRLLREGASWTDANYDHVPTETAPGHATMLTGAWPSETGIIANDWFDRAKGRKVNNVEDEDPSVKRLGGIGQRNPAYPDVVEDPISSPRNLLVSTLGDELKLATNRRSRVIGISVKNRAAILPAGRMADGAYWYSSQTGEFVSSTYYFDDRPKWVNDFNAEKRADKLCGKTWERMRSAADYEQRAGKDDASWEMGNKKFPYAAPTGEKAPNEFPHVIPGTPAAPSPACYDAINFTPFSNDLLVSFAKQAITNEHLGEDSDTDVLSVSFSANDIVGHRFGPYSHEMMDMTLQVDRQIGELLSFVDERVGRGNTVVVFTADHGVAPSPEHAAEVHLPGGRVRSTNVMTTVCERVRAHFKKPGDCEKDKTAGYGLLFSNGQIYFDRNALERDGVKAEEMERVVGEAALTVPGVSRYFTRTQLLNDEVSTADALARRVLHGFNAKRSGDVVLIQEPFKYLVEDSFASIVATHGAPYSYDTHVPLIIMGGGVAPGLYSQPATPADIAPTLASMLGVQAPSGATGRVLIEALK